MTHNDVTNWILVNYTATSLYSVIADGNYHKTNVKRAEWMSLINGAKLQSNCIKEGFNVQCYQAVSRIAILSDNRKDCATCDSVLGFGIQIYAAKWSSGNIETIIPQQKLKTFGYIFVQ